MVNLLRVKNQKDNDFDLNFQLAVIQAGNFQNLQFSFGI